MNYDIPRKILGKMNPDFKIWFPFTCHHCKRLGHLKRDCCAWRQKQAQREHARNYADVAEDVDATEMFDIVGQSIEDQWILDSGCSFHMCPHKEWFIDIRFMDERSVILGKDQIFPVMGIGNIKLKLHDGVVKNRQDVRYLPKLERHLISLGMLEANGFNFKSQEDELHVIIDSISVMRGIRHKILYYLDAVTNVGESGNNMVDESMLLHARLGYVGKKGLSELLRQQLLKHYKKLSVECSDECILAKSMKLPYPKSVLDEYSPFDCVYDDLWEPSRTESVGGARCFVSLMEYHSKRLWMYVLNSKGDCYAKFVGWYNLVMNRYVVFMENVKPYVDATGTKARGRYHVQNLLMA